MLDMKTSTVPSNYLTASETIQLIRDGQLTVEQLAKDHIERYLFRDEDVSAWVRLDEERILSEARRLDSVPTGQRGPLHGMIIGVKDIIETKDMNTEYGSLAYTGYQPGKDATIVAIARQAGALIYGKTQTSEFANGFIGPDAKNPYDPTRTPGGSSSGSAAAVRDYQCQIAFGTQTGGSLIRPASFCGVFGFKPSWGILSKEGIKPLAEMLDTPGFFARSLTDLQLLMSIYNVLPQSDQSPTKPINILDTASSSVNLKDCRFLYLKTEAWDLVKPRPSSELESAWNRSFRLLEKTGARVEESSLSEEFDGLTGPNGLIRTIVNGESAANLWMEYQNKDHYSKINWQNQDSARNASRTTAKDLLQALDRLATLRPVFDKLAGGYDAIVTPSVPAQAPLGLENTGNPIFNNIWTGLHVPVVHIPGFASEDGMPIGLSLIGSRFHDEELLRVARAVAGVWLDEDLHKLNDLKVPDGVINLQV